MFNPVSTRIVDLLNATAQFAVPKYQRGYEWKHAHAEELAQDLSYHANNREDGTLFLGTCIFQKHKGSVAKLSVVDGQQRITSLTLFLIACRARARELGQETMAHSISVKVSFRDNHGDYQGPKLVASPSIRDIYEHALGDNWKGDFPAKLAGKSMRWQTQRVEPVYRHFREVLASVTLEQLRALLDATYEAIVVRIDVEDDLDALSIFERTNARGQDLEIADLLKNHLYQHQVGNLDALWDEIGTNAGNQLLRMIKQFVVSERGYVQKKMIYRQLKKMIQEESAEAVTRRLLQFSRFFRAVGKGGNVNILKEFLDSIDCTRISGVEWNLNVFNSRLGALRSFGVSQHVPAVYAALMCMMRTAPQAEGSLLALAHALEKYHFVNTVICGRLGNEVEQPYATFALECNSASDLNAEVQKLCGVLRSKVPQEQEFVAGFGNVEYGPTHAATIAFVFDRILNAGKKRQDQWTAIFDADDREWIRRTHEVEHILPQKPGVPLSEKDAEVLHSVGNLMVVSNATNNRLGNKDVGEKMALLEQVPEIHYNYVATLVKGWKEREVKKWGAEEIERRADELAKRCYREVFKL